MTPTLSSNTQAILLLASPLIVGNSPKNAELLTPGEYRRLAKHLREIGREPSELLTHSFFDVAADCAAVVSPERLKRLIGRGFQLSQAIERWQARAIWVISRADPEYPASLKSRLRNDAPPILYGCGDPASLKLGGLAVVGSRAADEKLLSYTLEIGELVARADRTMISGGAKGIDQYAMRGALSAGGRVVGVLGDSLERQAMNRDHRTMIIDGQLTLVSPFDPSAGFNVGNAMQRNKSIYALSDAALVVSSDVGRGGTWAGAVEQLDKYRSVSIYVRSTGDSQPGLNALKSKGAVDWPNPADADSLSAILDAPRDYSATGELSLPEVLTPFSSAKKTPASNRNVATREASEIEAPGTAELPIIGPATPPVSPAEVIFQAASSAIEAVLTKAKKETEISDELGILPAQVRTWLARMCEEGLIERLTKPVRYQMRPKKLFD